MAANRIANAMKKNTGTARISNASLRGAASASHQALSSGARKAQRGARKAQRAAQVIQQVAVSVYFASGFSIAVTLPMAIVLPARRADRQEGAVSECRRGSLSRPTFVAQREAAELRRVGKLFEAHGIRRLENDARHLRRTRAATAMSGDTDERRRAATKRN